MRSGAREILLAGAVTFSGLGGLPQPTRAVIDTPQLTTTAVRIGTENPTPVFNQEEYVPNEYDASQIENVMLLFMESSSNPDFITQMRDRYFSDFQDYFGIHKAPHEFGFQYSPFGKENPVIIDFYAKEDVATDTNGQEFTHTINTLSLTVGDDGTLLTPRIEVDSFPLDNLPEIVEANFITMGMDQVEWQADIADPIRQMIIKEVSTPASVFMMAGDTLGNLFMGSESYLPVSNN